MGLDAFVPCSCFARGLAKPPPFEVTFDEGLPVPLRNLDDAEDAQLFEWAKTACSHEDMQVVSERISNWSGVRTLQDALAAVGEPVATLLAAIPDANGGSTDAATSRICIEQIATFRRVFKRMTLRLVANNAEPVYDYVAAYDGQFLWARGEAVGFDAKGVYVMQREPRLLKFQARRVVAIPRENGCELRDLDGDASVRCAWAHTVETSYEVVDHLETAVDYDYQLTALATVFRAAADHDTCVVWC